MPGATKDWAQWQAFEKRVTNFCMYKIEKCFYELSDCQFLEETG
jgi:hypothetical protein